MNSNRAVKNHTAMFVGGASNQEKSNSLPMFLKVLYTLASLYTTAPLRPYFLFINSVFIFQYVIFRRKFSKMLLKMKSWKDMLNVLSCENIFSIYFQLQIKNYLLFIYVGIVGWKQFFCLRNIKFLINVKIIHRIHEFLNSLIF